MAGVSLPVSNNLGGLGGIVDLGATQDGARTFTNGAPGGMPGDQAQILISQDGTFNDATFLCVVNGGDPTQTPVTREGKIPTFQYVRTYRTGIGNPSSPTFVVEVGSPVSSAGGGGGGATAWLLGGNLTGPNSIGLLDGSTFTVGGLSAGSQTSVASGAGAPVTVTAANTLSLAATAGNVTERATSGSLAFSANTALPIVSSPGQILYSASVGVEFAVPGVTISAGLVAPVASSLLSLFSTTQGSSPWPSMTTTQRNAISGPVAGLSVYNTTSNKVDFFNGTTWGSIGSASVPQVVYQPGGTAGGNVYTTFAAALAQAVALAPLQVELLVDSSVSNTGVVPAGAYAPPAGLTLRGRFQEGAATTTLTIQNGARLVPTDNVTIDGLVLIWQNTSAAAVALASGSLVIYVRNGGAINYNSGPATQPFATVASGATLILEADFSTLTGTTGAPVVSVASGGTADVYAFNSSVVSANTLTGAGTILATVDASSSPFYGATQTGASALQLVAPVRSNAAMTGFSFGGVAAPAANGVTVDTGAAGALLLGNGNASSFALGNLSAAVNGAVEISTGILSILDTSGGQIRVGGSSAAFSNSADSVQVRTINNGAIVMVAAGNGNATLDSGAGGGGSLFLGNTNATAFTLGAGTGVTGGIQAATLNVNTGAVASATNVGTGAAVQTVAVGSTNTTSSLTLRAGGTGGIGIGVASPGGGGTQIDAANPAGTLSLGIASLFTTMGATTATTVSVVGGGTTTFAANADAQTVQIGNVTGATSLALRAGSGGLTVTNNGTTYTWATSAPTNSVGQTVSVTPAGTMSFGRSIQTGNASLTSGVSAAISANISATSRIVAFLKTSTPGAGNLTVQFAALTADRSNGTPGSFKLTALLAAGTINVLDASNLDWALFDN